MSDNLVDIGMKYNIDDVTKASTEYFNGDSLAASVWIDKYLLRNNDDELLEKTPEDMHNRIAGEFARIEAKKFKNPLKHDEIFNLLDGFKYIVPQGSPMFGIGNKHKIVSLSNCYLTDSPEDSYGDILRVDEQIVQISKRRGGSGINISKLRPYGTPTKNAGKTSTGIVSFMERYSNSVREVGQNGRFGALIIILDVHHPDVLNFIKAKEDKTKVTGANISLQLSDEFLQAVKNDTEYELRWPVDARAKGEEPKISKMVSAKKIWNEIIEHNHKDAEPGLLFWDTVLKETPSSGYPNYKPMGTNPCCFSKESDVYVTTRNGLKEIKTITSVDEIYINETKEWVKTSGYFEQGKAKCYRVHFNNGETLDITDNHKLCTICEKRNGTKILYSEGDLVELKNLKVGDKIAIQVNAVRCKSYTKIKEIEYIGEKDVGCITVEKYHKFTANGIISGNSELILSPLDSCRLILLNLYSYVEKPFTKDAYFNYELFTKHCGILQRLMDDLVDLEAEKIEQIIAKIESDPESQYIKQREIDMWKTILKNNNDGRRTGSGTTGLADALAALGMGYGTEESITFTGDLFKKMKLSLYRESVEMAKELGSFVGFDPSVEEKSSFIQRIKSEDEALYNDMMKYGRRNIALMTLAPAGSVSILTQTSSGSEPVFQLEYKRRRKLSDSMTGEHETDANGDRWYMYSVYHPKVKVWMDITGETDITKSPWYGFTANSINWLNRVKMQGVMQKHICHSISATINLPKSVKQHEISEIYNAAWVNGCKGITVYRDGSRDGVLLNNDHNPNPTKIEKHNAPKRPKELSCDIHHVSITKKLDKVRTFEYMVIVGLYGTEPYEIFCLENGKHDKKLNTGKIIKEIKGRYHLILKDGSEIKDITAETTENEDALTRMVSTALRHGVDIQFIVDQLSKVEGEMFGFSKSIARSLKKYIKNGSQSGENCVCGAKYIFENGCYICKSCGKSKCA